MATLHFIFGKPAAGKTSLARRLTESERAVFFCEDEWLAAFADKISNLQEYLEYSRRCRAVIHPLATRVLTLGTNVVFDFAANTASGRAWVRSIFTATGASHVLHVLDVPDDECKRRLSARNRDRPAGLFFGEVTEAQYDEVVPHISAPGPDEGFQIRTHLHVPASAG